MADPVKPDSFVGPPLMEYLRWKNNALNKGPEETTANYKHNEKQVTRFKRNTPVEPEKSAIDEVVPTRKAAERTAQRKSARFKRGGPTVYREGDTPRYKPQNDIYGNTPVRGNSSDNIVTVHKPHPYKRSVVQEVSTQPLRGILKKSSDQPVPHQGKTIPAVKNRTTKTTGSNKEFYYSEYNKIHKYDKIHQYDKIVKYDKSHDYKTAHNYNHVHNYNKDVQPYNPHTYDTKYKEYKNTVILPKGDQQNITQRVTNVPKKSYGAKPIVATQKPRAAAPPRQDPRQKSGARPEQERPQNNYQTAQFQQQNPHQEPRTYDVNNSSRLVSNSPQVLYKKDLRSNKPMPADIMYDTERNKLKLAGADRKPNVGNNLSHVEVVSLLDMNGRSDPQSYQQRGRPVDNNGERQNSDANGGKRGVSYPSLLNKRNPENNEQVNRSMRDSDPSLPRLQNNNGAEKSSDRPSNPKNKTRSQGVSEHESSSPSDRDENHNNTRSKDGKDCACRWCKQDWNSGPSNIQNSNIYREQPDGIVYRHPQQMHLISPSGYIVATH